MITVIKQVKNESKKDYHKKFLVKCSCGKEYIMNSQQIKKTNVCIDCSRRCNLKLGSIAKKKDFCIYKTKLYHVWQSIKSRCNNKRMKYYYNYGGRGISMCKEWENPFEFYNWAMKNGYKENLTIDRIDVNGNYCPENCRWITMKEQQNNKRNNHYIIYNGSKKTMAEWAEQLGISYTCFKIRVKKYGVCEKTFFSGTYKTNGDIKTLDKKVL